MAREGTIAGCSRLSGQLSTGPTEPGLDPKVSSLERAFQLAGSGQVASVEDIRKRLKMEGYDQEVVNGGPSLTLQLRNRIKAARRLHRSSNDLK
jgi:hypothetical protein